MNQKEFLDIVLPLKDKMYRFAKRLLVSGDEAEDAVQEIYLKLWKGRDRIANYRNPEAFAMTMTKNYCLDRLKSGQASNLKIVHSNYQHSDNVQRKVEARDEVSILFQIMETLPEQQRMILQLRDVEQYEYEEIAEMLEIRENTIRVNLSRARKAVREQMIKHYNYGINQN
jgi:RNA polymerase sigma-70 factor (ECF subfamily)